MANAKKHETKARPAQPTQPDAAAEAKQTVGYAWMPRWGWVLLFFVPLLLSEYMFYRVGRGFNMVAFPIAWVAFWGWMLYRSDWAILRKR
jgi:hypothetical protein